MCLASVERWELLDLLSSLWYEEHPTSVEYNVTKLRNLKYVRKYGV